MTPKHTKTAPKRTQTAEITEISAADAAKRLFLTQQSIGMWCARPGAPVRKDGTRVLVRWPEFLRWREEELVKQAKADSAPVSLDDARSRKLNAEAELAELEVAKARGEFVAVADYEAALARVCDRLAARLRALPVRLSHLGAEVEAAAEAEAERIVTELSAFDEDVIEEFTPEQERAA